MFCESHPGFVTSIAVYVTSLAQTVKSCGEMPGFETWDGPTSERRGVGIVMPRALMPFGLQHLFSHQVVGIIKNAFPFGLSNADGYTPSSSMNVFALVDATSHETQAHLLPHLIQIHLQSRGKLLRINHPVALRCVIQMH